MPLDFHFEGRGKPLVVSVEQENCFRGTVVLATVVDPQLSNSRASVHQKPTEQFSFKNRGKSKTPSTSRSKAANQSKFTSRHLNRTSHASFFHQREKSRQHSTGRGKAAAGPITIPDENGDHIPVPDETENMGDTTVPDGSVDDVTMLSPEIPLQHFGKHGIDDPVGEPQFKRIKDVFFSIDPSQLDSTVQVLAPDSDEER